MKELSHRKEGLAENIEKWNMLLSLVEEVDERKEETLETIQAIRAGAWENVQKYVKTEESNLPAVSCPAPGPTVW